jgi:hypothetical protein
LLGPVCLRIVMLVSITKLVGLRKPLVAFTNQCKHLYP